MSSALRGIAALVVMGCATTPTRYEIEYEAGALCIIASDGIGGTEGESWRRCVSEAALALAQHPELVPIVRTAWRSCTGSSGIAPQSPAMDACLREELALEANRARNTATTGEIIGEILLRGLSGAAAAQQQAPAPAYVPMPPSQVYCTSQPDGWGGVTTVCH